MNSEEQETFVRTIDELQQRIARLEQRAPSADSLHRTAERLLDHAELQVRVRKLEERLDEKEDEDEEQSNPLWETVSQEQFTGVRKSIDEAYARLERAVSEEISKLRIEMSSLRDRVNQSAPINPYGPRGQGRPGIDFAPGG